MKERYLKAKSQDTLTTVVYTGKNLRTVRTKYTDSWLGRENEAKELVKKGILPGMRDNTGFYGGNWVDSETEDSQCPAG